MKILVIGAEGQVGTFFMRSLAGRHQMTGTAMLPDQGFEALDIRDSAAVLRRAEELRPGYVILTAALTHVDQCEEQPGLARAVNLNGAVHVAQACRKIGAGMMFFSTDYVFDGQAGPYAETDAPNPQSVYARTKFEAEQQVAALVEKHLIIRTMMVFSYLPGSLNYYMQVLLRASQSQPITAPGDQIGNPTHAANLVQVAAELMETDATGLFHVAGATLLSKADFARKIVAHAGHHPALVGEVRTAECGQKAARPLRSGLCTNKAAAALKTNRIWTLDESLQYCQEQRQQHENAARLS